MKEKLYTQEFIKEKLEKDVKWMERALVVLHNNQTKDEQTKGDTLLHNKIGFNGVDGRYLSYCARWIISGKHLNDKHREKCAKKLPKYWKQISEAIKQKEGV